MKTTLRRLSLQATLASCVLCLGQTSVQAGPLADWWINQAKPTYPLTPAGVPVTSGYGAYGYNAYTGYPNTSYSPVLPLSLPQTNPAYLPTGAYASQYYKAPTTYYRPVTSFDPNLGTTVTSLQPCQSYQYQAQRVPLLTPSWQNYAYGGYGSTVPQNRWSPVTPPTYQPSVAAPYVGSAAGQSGLSIASGFGTYGTSPVVQPTATYSHTTNYPVSPLGTVVGVAPSGSLPLANAGTAPIVSGYGGIHYGQPTTSTSVIGSSVVPAASWTPSGTTITPIGPTYSTPSPSPTTPVSGYGTSSFGPMPGSAGLPTIPSAVSPSVGLPNSSSGSSTFAPNSFAPSGSSVLPPVLPNDPASTNVLPYNSTPSIPSFPATGSTIYDRESTIVPSLNLSQSDGQSNALKPTTESTERPRFQLRSVEQSPQPNTTSNATSPWSRDESAKPTAPSPLELKSLPENSNENLKLDLNTDALRPIPAPSGFDAAPDWKPSLLNARDQTARVSELKPVYLEGPVDSIQPVRYLQGIRPIESKQSIPSKVEDLGVRVQLRPIK